MDEKMKKRIDDLVAVIKERSTSERTSVWQGFIYGLRQMCTSDELAYLNDQLAILERVEKLEKWDQQFMEATIDVRKFVEATSINKHQGAMTMSMGTQQALISAQQNAINAQMSVQHQLNNPFIGSVYIQGTNNK